jgi:hypothetical protein
MPSTLRSPPVQPRDANWCEGDAKEEPALTPPRAWVEDTEGQCGGEACSDHQMLWAEVFLRGEDLGGFAALAGLWRGVGGEVVHEINVLRIRADGSINNLSLYEYDNYDSADQLVYYKGQLVDRGSGRYSATLYHNRYDIPPFRYQIEVVDCAAGRPAPPDCMHYTGPFELHVEGDYAYTDLFGRLKCGRAYPAVELPPQSDPYVSPCG